MLVSRILAIDDVCLMACEVGVEQLHWFYGDLLGLMFLPSESDEERLAFCGYPRSGPRVHLGLNRRIENRRLRRQLLVEVPSLFDLAEILKENGMYLIWSRGWSFYDRRLTTLDPAGNRIEAVTSHPW